MGAREDLLRPAAEAAVVVARGMQPASAVPGTLRPFLNFSQLPAQAVAAALRVLDENSEFREIVMGAVNEEILGEAGRLYLERPDGWQDALAAIEAGERSARATEQERRAEHEAGRRLEAVEERLRRVTRELEQAGKAAAELRRDLNEERQGRRTAESEAGRLRQQLTQLQERLDSGRERVAAAEGLHADLDELRSQVGGLQAALEKERARRQAAETERSRAAEERIAPSAPAGLDAAAVASAMGAATQAVADLAAALRLAAAELEPWLPEAGGDVGGEVPESSSPGPSAGRRRARPVRRRPASLPPAVLDTDPEAAGHLLRLPQVLVLVDGYNVTHAARPDRPIADQRRWLAGAAAGLSATTGAELVIVFDGTERSAPADLPRRAGVRIQFTGDGVEADDAILGIIPTIPPGRPVVVASSDNRVRDGARRAGANVVSSEQLLALLPG